LYFETGNVDGQKYKSLAKALSRPLFQDSLASRALPKAKGLGQSLVSGMPCFKGITQWKALAQTIGFWISSLSFEKNTPYL
jgi:hypothetical protein